MPDDSVRELPGYLWMALLFAPGTDFAYPLFIPRIPSGSFRTTRDTIRPIFRARHEIISVVAGCGFDCFDRLALFLHPPSPGRTVVAGPKLFSWVFRAPVFRIRGLARPLPHR